MPRKRFNAFEDFPIDKKDQPDWQPSAEKAAEEQPAQENALFGGSRVLAQPEAPQVERIERLKPSQMIPDRFQPRRLLPTALRQPFYSGQIDCYMAARQWLKMAQNDEGLKEQVDALLRMGSSFGEHGQIKPITGSWVETGDGSYIFQIETGERRFWAACLQTVEQSRQEEPLLRVEVISHPTRMRQVLENRHAEPPSAVGQACEIASLILAELDIHPTGEIKDEFDYFRQAVDRRMPNGVWDRLFAIMNISRVQMKHHLLEILRLPTPLLDLADRYRVPERVLREVMDAPPEQWEPLLRASIRNNLTSDDVAELTNKRPPKEEKRPSTAADPIQQAINSLKRFSAIMVTLDEDTQSAILDELAGDLALNEQGEPMTTLLRDLAERIRIRQQNRYRRR